MYATAIAIAPKGSLGLVRFSFNTIEFQDLNSEAFDYYMTLDEEFSIRFVQLISKEKAIITDKVISWDGDPYISGVNSEGNSVERQYDYSERYGTEVKVVPADDAMAIAREWPE